jgi:hypothetical protein
MFAEHLVLVHSATAGLLDERWLAVDSSWSD